MGDDTEPAEHPPVWRRMLDPWVIVVPLLAALEPIAAFSYQFRFELAGAFAGGAWFLATLLVAWGALALVLWRRPSTDPAVAAFVAGALILAFFHYRAWVDALIPGRGAAFQLLFWVLATALVVWGVVKLARFGGVRWFAVLFVAFLTGLQVVALVGYRQELAGASAPVPSPPLPEPVVVPEDRPDVYWFVLDMLPRPDVASEALGLDLGPFVEDLEDDGFVVADDSWGSYFRTYLSVASTLDMGYPFVEGNDLRNEYQASVPLFIDDSATYRRFGELGYQIAYAPAAVPNWSPCGAAADICAAHGGSLLRQDDLGKVLIDTTALGALDLVHLIYTDPLTGYEAIAERRDSDQPLFAFVHVLAPHPPSFYTEDCEVLDEALGGDALLSPEDRAARVANEAACVTAIMSETVDRILAEDPDAVIIIQGDHGTKVDGEWEAPDAWSPEDLQERLGAFDAIRLPASCAPTDPRWQSLVNTFRLVFACLEGAPPDLLDFRAFNSEYGDIGGMLELDLDQGELRLGPG